MSSGQLSGRGHPNPRATVPQQGKHKVVEGGHSLKQNRNANVGTRKACSGVQQHCRRGNVSGNLHPAQSKINLPLVTLFLPSRPTGSQSKKSNCKKKTEQKRKMRKKRTKINCWTVTLFLPRSQLVQDFPRTMAPVVLQLVLSAVA